MADTEHAPDAVEELRTILAEHDFQLTEELSEPALFGDRRLRWTRSDVRIQASLDRGRWFIDVMPTWAPDWFGQGLEIVMDTLDDQPAFTHLLTLREAVDILEERLEEITDLVASADGWEAIESRRRARAQRWFGN